MKMYKLNELQEKIFGKKQNVGFICDSCKQRVTKVVEWNLTDSDEYTYYFAICETCATNALTLLKGEE